MLVVEILVAGVMFVGLIAVVDRFCTWWSVEDPMTVAARRRTRRSLRRRRPRIRARRPSPAPEPPPRRPIETVAADLRRLVHQMAVVPSGSTLVRWKALWAAYDGALTEAAEMLELREELEAQPPGIARDIERVRILAALEDAGLRVRD